LIPVIKATNAGLTIQTAYTTAKAKRFLMPSPGLVIWVSGGMAMCSVKYWMAAVLGAEQVEKEVLSLISGTIAMGRLSGGLTVLTMVAARTMGPKRILVSMPIF